MTRGMLADEDVPPDHADDATPQGRHSEDVAAQVVVLASERLSGHVPGEVVTIAGGIEGRILHPDG